MSPLLELLPRNLSPSRDLFKPDDAALDEEFNLDKTEELNNDNDDEDDSKSTFTSLLLIILLLNLFLRSESFWDLFVLKRFSRNEMSLFASLCDVDMWCAWL